MTTFAEFDAEIRLLDGQLSPRKATPLYYPCVKRMGEVSGMGDIERRTCQEHVPDAVVHFWRRAYELYASDPFAPGGKQFENIEAVLDAAELPPRSKP